MKATGIGAAAVMLLVLVAACSAPVSLPETPPDASGTIENLVLAGPRTGEPLPESGGQPVDRYEFTLAGVPEGEYFHRANLILAPNAVIVDEDGRQLEPSALADGMSVDVWVRDECLESDPVQCGVHALRVLED